MIVIAASNRLDSLDPALLRPGRFDRQVLVGVPDLRGRREILEVHTQGKPLAPGPRPEPIARQTAGLAGADLENITNEAAIHAGRGGRTKIDRDDFDWAVERVVAGLQTKRIISEREKTVIAYHEAGHALISHLLGDARSLAKVTIVPRGPALGYTLNLPEEDRYLRTREELLDEIRMLLGGRAAEQLAFGKVSTGAANDLERVTAIARAMVFEFGMGETVHARTVRADNYASPRRPSGSATTSRAASATAATRTPWPWSRSTASRSSAWPRRSWSARRSTARRSSELLARRARTLGRVGGDRHPARAVRAAVGDGRPGRLRPSGDPFVDAASSSSSPSASISACLASRAATGVVDAPAPRR